ncbi:MAG: ABC transporter ATP-binding protein [Candidatus Omnitrophica bacterium]|nr:ABC transporter ATP-binding protein [Candidatus Omnitrophota bacterium]
MNGFKNSKFYLRLTILRQFFYIMGVRPIHIILPIVLSFIAASFDGISLGLLIPLARGIVENNFGFISETPLLKHVFAFAGGLFHSIGPGFSHNKNIFLFLVVTIFLAVVLKNIIGYINSVVFAYWHTRFKNNIYKFVFNRFVSFGKLFFDRTSQGYLNLVLDYSERVMDLLDAFERSIKNFFTLIVYFVIMFIISYKLTLITIVLFPILHFVLKAIISKIGRVAELKNAVKVDLSRRVFNILSCIPLIKAYSKEDETKKMYATINDDLRKLDFRAQRTIALIEPIQELIITTALLVMISVVALLLARDKPGDISVFVVFFYAARRSLPMFNIFNEMRSIFAQIKPPLKEISKILDDKDKFFVAGGSKRFEGLRSGIEFNHLNFSYIKGIQVLKDIKFFIEKGKMTAIVGPTGAGKTTLISLLMRFYDCPPSSILVDGVDIRDFTLKSLRAHITLVSQEVLLLNDTLKNNITFGLDREITIDQMVDVAKKARLYDFVMRLPDGFDTEIGDRGVRLSGGEKQRVAIARSLLKGSEIFILDEATSSLDSQTEIIIQDAINEAAHGRTAIVIAHRLSTIKHADKIIVIENGRLIEEGPLSELLSKKGKFYEYWEAQKFY